MRSAAARAASRRGSSTMILRPVTQGSARRASGTRVVLPAPGGATRTAADSARKAAASAGRTSSIGSAGKELLCLMQQPMPAAIAPVKRESTVDAAPAAP